MNKNKIEDWTGEIHQGDAVETLSEIPESSIHMMMTSPPYFGLRDYDHEDQIGLEDSLDEYINELIQVFREVRRVLRSDGSVWLNLGDSYAQSGGPNHDKSGTTPDGQDHERGHDDGAYGAKNKMLVPHRVAIALQEDGWIVRNDVTWAKPNPMPQSVKDRLNTTTEQIFYLTIEPDYYYDLDAIRESHAEDSKRLSKTDDHAYRDDAGQHTMESEKRAHPAGKNPGDVFEVTTKPFPDAHFAVYPPELCEKPIKATCPPKVCVACGAPYEREVERDSLHRSELPQDDPRYRPNKYDTPSDQISVQKEGSFSQIKDKGWRQTCDCATDATEPGIALDPFAGAGTTCKVAEQHGRRWVGIDLNAEYAEMAKDRIRKETGFVQEDPLDY